MNLTFIDSFFHIILPLPNVLYPADSDTKSQLKLLLQIATKSRLKQGQDKKDDNMQIFYCKAKGKSCFRIAVDFSEKGVYNIVSDYRLMQHENGCEVKGEGAKTLQIYNLMMLKKNVLQDFMYANDLIEQSPQIILQTISEGQEYFYCKMIHELENRRKLKKRFDNVVNISIKKKKYLENLASENNPQQPVKDLPKLLSNEQKLSNQLKYFENSIPQNEQKPKPKELMEIGSHEEPLKERNQVELKMYKHDEVEKSEKHNLNIFDDLQVNDWLQEKSSKLSIEYKREDEDNEILEYLFKSIKNNLFQSLEKKSLKEVDQNIVEK